MPTSDDDIAWLQLFRGLNRSGAALQTQIRQLLAAAIEQQHLSAGHRLPSSRRLAGMPGVSRSP